MNPALYTTTSEASDIYLSDTQQTPVNKIYSPPDLGGFFISLIQMSFFIEHAGGYKCHLGGYVTS